MSPGLLWAWHGLVTAARLELCSGSSTAASNTRVCFSRGKTWKRCVVVHRASDLGHTGANLPWPGVLREEQVGQVPPCYPGPPLVLGSGNLASAAFTNLLCRATSVFCQETCSKPWENLAMGTGVENINSL